MTLTSEAQELVVIDPGMGHAQPMGGPLSLIPLEVVDMSSHQDDHAHHSTDESLEVSEPVDVEIVVDELPGAPAGTKDPEPILEVEEEPEKEDENDAASSKKPEKWDWASKGPTGFVAWVKERIVDVPKHSGFDSAGLERAVSYLEKLDNEISKAMRLDLDGELDANKIEEVRAKIDEGISRLHDRLDKVKSSKKKSRKKKSDVDFSTSLVKEGQKITGVQGVFVTVPLLISRIARVCINGMVSAGHDIEDLYEKQVKMYKLSEREQAEVRQLLEDMGYALRQDRGTFPNDDYDFASSDNLDFAANYKG